MNQQNLRGTFSFTPDSTTAPVNNENAAKYKILVVEDEPATAKHILTALSRAGMECRHAPDGRVGLEALEAEEFHLLMLDLALPEVNGYELCRQIRATSTMPIIVVTAEDGFDAQLKSFRIGADDYLTKPFAPQFLVLRVITLLRRTYIYNGERQSNAPSASPQSAPSKKVSSVPGGWSRCEGCGYMGPALKFEREDDNGQREIACPNCQEKAHIAFSLG
jgi:PleD family two-component response regulator